MKQEEVNCPTAEGGSEEEREESLREKCGGVAAKGDKQKLEIEKCKQKEEES